MGTEQRELRIAPVMTGGTSLAVWMGGATVELYRALHADPADDLRPTGGDVYRLLREWTGTKVVVDVITGTSAGGLNGALLAAACSMRLPADEFVAVRSIWQEVADLEPLLRRPGDADPPSLLRGEDHFEAELRRALRRLRSTAAAHRSGLAERRDDDPQRAVDLVTTLTTVTPIRSLRADAFGDLISEPTHAQQLRFAPAHLTGEMSDELIDKLVVAARTSATIPGVFEPSFLAVGADDAKASKRPNLAGHASFAVSRWAVDGGVVVNLPVTEALDRIYERPAMTEVRRVVLYVNPTPSADREQELDEADSPPDLLRSATTIVTAPRAEGIAGDLDELDRHNRQVRRQEQARAALATLYASVVPGGDVGPLFDRYRARRAEESVLRMVDRALQHRPGATPEQRRALVDAFRPHRLALLPEELDEFGPPTGSDTATRWGWGIAPVDHEVAAAISLLRRVLAASSRRAEARRVVEAQLAKLHDHRARVAAVRALDDAYWSNRFASWTSDTPTADPATWYGEWPYASATDLAIGRALFTAAKAGAAASAATAALEARPAHEGAAAASLAAMAVALVPGAAAAAPLDRGPVFDTSTTDRAELEERARREVVEVLRGTHFQVAGALLASKQALDDLLADPAPGTEPAQVEELRDEARMLLDGAEGKTDVGRRLLLRHVLQQVLIGDLIIREQRVDLVQLSSHRVGVPTRLDDRTSEEKLAGPELGRLGAFLKPSWRANDWFWGRMDAAHRLVLLLLDPAELRARGSVTAVREHLEDRGALNPDIVRELAEVEGAEELPPALPHTAAALAEELQLEIARDELDHVARAVEETVERGGVEGDRGAFRRAVAAHPGERDDDAVRAIVGALRVGDEELAGDLGHGLSTRLLTRAAAVAVNALTAPTAGVPVIGRILRPLRAPVHAAAAVVDWLTHASPLRRAVGVFLAALASAAVALRLLGGEVPAAVVGLSVGVLTVLLVVAVLRFGAVRSALGLAAVGSVVALAILGPDVGSILYDQPAAPVEEAVGEGATLVADGGGQVRVDRDGDGERLSDLEVAAGGSVELRGTAGRVVTPATEVQDQGWKRWAIVAPASALTIVAGLLLLGLVLRAAARRRWPELAVLLLLGPLVIADLRWLATEVVTGPADDDGPKALVVDVATWLHDAGPIVVTAVVVAAGVLLATVWSSGRELIARVRVGRPGGAR